MTNREKAIIFPHVAATSRIARHKSTSRVNAVTISEQIMPAIVKRRPGPRGPRLDYSRILKLLKKKPALSYTEIAAMAKCSAASVSRFAALPASKRNALAAK